jgi:uncharacterized protein (TIGR00251 family)
VVKLAVRVQPRARRTEVAGERAGAVVVRVTAPPVDGKANAAVCAFVASRAGVPRSAVTVVHGAGTRDKVLEVRGVDLGSLRRSLGLDG